MLHRLCEKLREVSPISNFVGSQLKRVLVKNRENKYLFKNTYGLALPKFPVITRWGTWIYFMYDVAIKYDLYKSFLRDLVEKNNECLPIFESFINENFILELKEIKKEFFIVEGITNLEKQNLSTTKQINILKDVQKNRKSHIES
ncbi:hypothetical protein DMUE_3871 [Dictyocoela muelleri]|nr:hypothetical protein DMUE_3871 [Dictyocoela muelleri]